MASSKKVPLMIASQPKTGNSNMAAQTGNTCISETVIDNVKIPKVMMLWFSTVTSSRKVSSNDCSNDRQPEIENGRPHRQS